MNSIIARTSSTAAPKASIDDLLSDVIPQRARIIFAIDATGSRQPTWDQAAVVQAQMFYAADNVSAQLVYFQGWAGTTKASQWFDDPKPLADVMGRISCLAGTTQIKKVLQHAAKEHAIEPVSALILIGDACEEKESDLVAAARELPVPAFMFQEGRSDLVAEIYSRIAEITGGALAQFDASSATNLGELLKAVAVYATGGVKALTAHGGETARLFLTQIKK